MSVQGLCIINALHDKSGGFKTNELDDNPDFSCVIGAVRVFRFLKARVKRTGSRTS